MKADSLQNESSRLTRLADIARAINDATTDAVALTTEAAQLCGFSIWKEDRTQIAGPSALPALHLAVTDTEIREFTQMFRSGHSVALGDLIGAMDVLFTRIGGQGSVGPDLTTWLQTGLGSENASIQALTAFLRDLGAYRPGPAFGSFAGEAERLDPIQSLFILRVLTEDMAVPLRRALAKMKAGEPLAGPLVTPDGWRPEHLAPAGPDDGSPAGLAEPRAPQLTPCPEAPGYSEDAYVVGVTGIFEKVTAGKKFIGKYTEGVQENNAILSIIKFIATYTFLDGKMRVEAPGQPLVRTKTRSSGDGTRTVVAHFFIDGSRVTDWMKDHRCLVALAGLDLDMPKTGNLKGVRTEWFVDQSTVPREQLIQPLNGTGSLYAIRTNDDGEAAVTFTGNSQQTDLDPKKVMPIEKTVTIRVTPQVKATEMKQDLVDAVTGAIGIEGGGVGLLTPLMETLYRMNWTGEIHLDLRVRDWQQADTIGQLTVEVKGVGHEFRKQYALHMTIGRSLTFVDTEMRVIGGEMPAALDPEVLKNVPAAQRALMQQQMEAYATQMTDLAQTRQFIGAGPGIARMSIADVKSLLTKDESWDTSERETLAGTRDFELSPEQLSTYFSVKVDLGKKTATLAILAVMKALVVSDARYRYWPSIPAELRSSVERPKSHQTRERSLGIFTGLNLQSPFDPTKETIVIPLKEEPIIDGGGAMNYYGAIPIPFTFGPNNQFKGTALVAYSVTRKVVKPK